MLFKCDSGCGTAVCTNSERPISMFRTGKVFYSHLNKYKCFQDGRCHVAACNCKHQTESSLYWSSFQSEDVYRCPTTQVSVFSPDFEKHVKVTESVYQTRERFSDLKSVTLEVMQYHFNHLNFNCL